MLQKAQFIVSLASDRLNIPLFIAIKYSRRLKHRSEVGPVKSTASCNKAVQNRSRQVLIKLRVRIIAQIPLQMQASRRFPTGWCGGMCDRISLCFSHIFFCPRMDRWHFSGMSVVDHFLSNSSIYVLYLNKY